MLNLSLFLLLCAAGHVPPQLSRPTQRVVPRLADRYLACASWRSCGQYRGHQHVQNRRRNFDSFIVRASGSAPSDALEEDSQSSAAIHGGSANEPGAKSGGCMVEDLQAERDNSEATLGRRSTSLASRVSTPLSETACVSSSSFSSHMPCTVPRAPISKNQ